MIFAVTGFDENFKDFMLTTTHSATLVALCSSNTDTKMVRAFHNNASVLWCLSMLLKESVVGEN